MSILKLVNFAKNGRSFSTTSVIRGLQETFYNEEQLAIQETVKKLANEVINPFAEEWNQKQIFPAHKVFQEFGKAGLLGINKPAEYGGMGLPYKYEVENSRLRVKSIFF